MPKSNPIIPWRSASPIAIPGNVTSPKEILETYAITLRALDKRSLINAFEHGDYAMGAGHLWRRTMSKLRSRLAALGMQFLGEMLNREDISEQSTPEAVLTDHDTIFLAESLGYIDATGAMRLRQGFEQVAHFDSDRANDEMSLIEASTIVRACVQYIFGPEENTTAIDFSHFRERLSSETLKEGDVAVSQLFESPLFFIRTALRVLLAASKIEESARLEHSLANLNVLLPGMWPKLADDDKWSVGSTFAELSNVGKKPTSIAGVRKALLKVKGFDFVPENLRSNSFKRAAQALLMAHHGYNNFYTEPEPARHLSTMGTSIPPPAFAECVRAYICVYLGNNYGVCWESAGIAEEELKKISKERWEPYFARVFPGERDILWKLVGTPQTSRWISLWEILELSGITRPPGAVGKLIDATVKKSAKDVMSQAAALVYNFRGA